MRIPEGVWRKTEKAYETLPVPGMMKKPDCGRQALLPMGSVRDNIIIGTKRDRKRIAVFLSFFVRDLFPYIWE